MRTAIIGTGLLLASLLAASCASNDDPITTKCQSICKLDPSAPCAARQNDCILDCRSYATKAQTFGGPKCSDCVAGTYVYVVDPTGKCNATGFTHQPELSQDCYSSCVKPDGAASGL